MVIDFPLVALSAEDEQLLVQRLAVRHPEVVSQEDAIEVTLKPLAEQIARYLAALHSVGPRGLAVGLPLLLEKLNEFGQQMASIIEIGEDVEDRPSG